MASFLPIVAQLGEEYEPHAIAAAALQMAYDQTRPPHLSADYADEDEQPISLPKPKLVKNRSRNSSTPNRRSQVSR